MKTISIINMLKKFRCIISIILFFSTLGANGQNISRNATVPQDSTVVDTTLVNYFYLRPSSRIQTIDSDYIQRIKEFMSDSIIHDLDYEWFGQSNNVSFNADSLSISEFELDIDNNSTVFDAFDNFGHGKNDFDNTDIDNTNSRGAEAVGSIGGIFDVSPTGAATYTIPIEAPIGIGGIQPSVAIVYNSQAGNGVAGWGCNIAGISAITRAPTNIYHDGAATKDANAYYLDGQRLIPESTQIFQIIYKLENDPSTKVTSKGNIVFYPPNPSNPLDSDDTSWFEVEKNGIKYHYGSNSNSCIKYTKNKDRKIYTWYLARVEDIYGNYMEYNYADNIDTNVRYLNSITYGKNTNLSSSFVNTISFAYTTRQDPIVYTMDGIKVSATRRLSTITTKTGSNAYRTYTLEYNTTSDGTASKFSRLTTVTVKNSANEALKPITFDWNYLLSFSQSSISTSLQNFTYPVNVPHTDQSFIAADLNGDGISDLIGTFPIKIPTGQNSWNNTNYAVIYWGSVNASEYPQFTTISAYDIGSGALYGSSTVIDFDGNGINELLVPYTNITQYWRVVEFVFFNGALNNMGFGHNLVSSSNEMPVYVTGDFDNDGKGDIIFIERGHSSNLYRCVIVGHVQGTSLKSGVFDLSMPSNNKPEQIFVADFNGNGLNDVMIVHKNGYRIFWNQGGGINNSTLWNNILAYTDGTNINNEENKNIIKIGDFNGDGLLDFIINEKDNNSSWYFALNNGDGTFAKQLVCSLNHGIMELWKDISCHIFDFDNDGKSDVIITKPLYGTLLTSIYFKKTHTYWMRSTGTALSQVASAESNDKHDSESRFIVSGDFSGNGKTELINLGYNMYNGTSTTRIWRFYVNPNHSAHRGKIASIKDGYDVTTSITYYSFPNGGFYTRGTGATYPVIDCTPPLHAVKTVYTGNGAAGSMTTNYSYAGLKIHLQGKGLMGMSSITANNTTIGKETKNSVKTWNTTWFAPSEISTEVKINNMTATTTVNYTFVDKGSKKVFIYPNKKTEKDFYNNTTTSLYTYDSNDNLIRDSVIYASNMYRSTRYGNYELIAGVYRPKRITVAQMHPDNSTNVFKQITQLEYNNKGRVNKKVENFGTTSPLTAEYDYDLIGNLTLAKVSGTGVKTITTHTDYDTNKRFPVKQYTTPASTISSFVYDAWGNLTKEKDETNPSNVLTIEHEYDNWGRRMQTTMPDGREIEYQTGWNTTTNLSKRYYTLIQGNDIPWEKRWYDAVGREVSIETVGAKNMNITQNHEFYTSTNVSSGYFAGMLKKTQTINGNINVSETFTYYGDGRLKSRTSTSGQTTTYTYANRSQTTISDGRSYIKTFDAWGNIKTSSEPNSASVTYLYHSSGAPREITAAGTTFSMTYDGTGRQSKLTDPNAGNTLWEYDAAGRVTKQTDGRGVVTTTHRDKLGRDSCLVQVQGGVSTTTKYHYGTSGNNLQRLTKAETGDYNVVYDYDNKGRIQSETRTVPNEAPLMFGYIYNNKGQLEKTTYPNSVEVNNEYDSYGNLVKVLAGVQSVWELTGNTGTVTTTKMGTAITATTTRNSQGMLTNMKAVLGGGTFHNMDFEFDPVRGNLSSRTGMITQSESFTYDDLDRLKTVKHNNVTNMTLGYQSNGNIQSKTGLGVYTYHSTRKHAVEYIENTGGLIPERQQLIYNNAFNKVNKITETIDGVNHTYNIMYGPDRQRWKTELIKGSAVARKVIYAGDYEEITEDGINKQFIYLPGGGVYVKQSGQADKIYYTHTDHLGSIVLITEDISTTPVFKASYDAWGKQTLTANTFKFHRGYTGHEHLPEFGLINMNGRMYNPILGRFLSPDPFVQAPDWSQSFNRYSAMRNNPLIYVDPDGELVWFVPIIIGAVIGGTTGGIMAKQAGASGFWEWAGYIGGGALIGGLSGGAAVGVSALGGGAALAGMVAGGIGGAGFSGLATRWDGQAMLQGAAFGAISGFVGGGIASAIGGGWGALAGGATSNLTSQLLYNGGDFSNVDWASVGFSGALSFGMYHGMQYAQYQIMGGQIGGQDVTYRQFSKINTAYQRSRFWRREFGVYLNEDGSAKITPWKDTNKLHVKFRPSEGNINKTAHAHWAKEGQDWVYDPDYDSYTRAGNTPKQPYSSNAYVTETVGGYHSPGDMAGLRGTSFVVGRTSSSYLTNSMSGWRYTSDPFVRYFLFPFLSLR